MNQVGAGNLQRPRVSIWRIRRGRCSALEG